MSHRLPADVVSEARQAFAFVDREKKGVLDAASISVVLRAIGVKPPDLHDWKEIKAMRRPAFDGVSATGEGVVSLDEFLAIVAFKSQDRDGYADIVEALATIAGIVGGTVDESDSFRVPSERLLRTLTNVGHRLRPAQVQQVISIVDPHSTGSVDASRLAGVLISQS